MSIRALSWAMSTDTGSPTRKAVLLALADRYNEDEDAAWPSVGWIARATELSDKSVKRAIVDLVDAGLIELVGWSRGRPDRRTKKYRLVIHRPVTAGGRSVPSRQSRGDTLSARGDTLSSTGGHSDPRTIREPIQNRAPVNGVEPLDGADPSQLIDADSIRTLRKALR